MSDEAPKSALELAMERLRKRDQDAGVEQKAVTDSQRAAIAEAKNLCEARLAEREILHRAALAASFDPAERAALEDAYRRDRDRLVSDRDHKIQRIRRGLE
ncbi:MAG: hypothetical protein U0Q12_12700 [Vicinamibacterales bacterium]